MVQLNIGYNCIFFFACLFSQSQIYTLITTQHFQSTWCISKIDRFESFFNIFLVSITLFLFVITLKVQCLCCSVFQIVFLVIFLFVMLFVKCVNNLIKKE